MSRLSLVRAWLCAGACLLASAVFAASPAVAQDEKVSIAGVAPLSPQPSEDAITPGLAVEYLYDKFYTLDEIHDAEVDPVPGEPVADLNTVTETDPATGEDKVVSVLTSDQDILVGALIRGAIHFPEPGTYVLRVTSNDGVRVWIGGALVWDDPEVHFDRMSPPLELAIQESGWYEFKADYYQKKGSWALQVLWTPPGGGEAAPVPPEAFGHMN